LLIAFHGSWDRSSPIGYSIEKVNIFANSVSSSEYFLHGWLRSSEVFGRPVDLIFSEKGDLFITDDYAGLVYIYNKGK
jgi:glucose/arabinose dehydrogenase